jgi:Zn-dependent protease with chaperone function
MATLDDYLHTISEKDHPSLHRAVEELAEKAGINKPVLYQPKVRHPVLEAMPVAMFETAAGKDGIVLNERMLRRVFPRAGRISGNIAISDEIKAMIAHEMGHIKRGDARAFGMGRISSFTPLACMAGAVAGLYIMRSYWKKNKEPMPVQDAEDQIKVPEPIKSPTLEAVKKVALYTVAAGAGLTAGIFMMRGMRHHMEYACDAFSKEMMGSGKPLASALDQFRQYSDKLAENVLKHYPEEKRESIKRGIKIIEELLHPPIVKRIERLQ